MAYLTRDDIPFHYQLADAFTICDAYHCSLLGPTDPNRYHMWTRLGRQRRQRRRPGDRQRRNSATAGRTYPEVLQNAGITWKIYQDMGTGLDASGSWGWTHDAVHRQLRRQLTALLQPISATRSRATRCTTARVPARTSANGDGYFDILKRDVAEQRAAASLVDRRAGGVLRAPELAGELRRVVRRSGSADSLTSNPEVWSKTVLLINYDENDGFFDHIAPPFRAGTARKGLSTVDTVNEIYAGSASNPAGPYGLGPRVPMLVVSPWTKGRLRVLGGVRPYVGDPLYREAFRPASKSLESNITPWRRAVCGDLMSAFNFKTPNDAFPTLPRRPAMCRPIRIAIRTMCRCRRHPGRAEAGTRRAPGARAALRTVRARAR